MRKIARLLFILILAVSSLLMVRPASSDILKPSIPEFTVKYVPASYSITTINPYTGQKVTQQYNNNTIKLSITNQLYTYSNGSTFYVYYNIRTKGHFEQNWTELYPTVGLLPNSEAYQHSNYKDYYTQYVAFTAEDSQNDYLGLPQSDFTYTIISLPAPTSNGQVDFQVEAMIGCNSTAYDPTNNFVYDPASGGVNRPAVAYVTSSGWSDTQTLTIGESQTPNSSPANSPTPSSESLQTEITTIVGVVIALAAIGAGLGLLIYLIRRK
jgi:hypothetical protein